VYAEPFKSQVSCQYRETLEFVTCHQIESKSHMNSLRNVIWPLWLKSLKRLAQVVPQNFAHLVEFLAVRIPQALSAWNPTWHKSVTSRIERGSGTQQTCSPRAGQ
jgi:hypothetical protein